MPELFGAAVARIDRAEMLRQDFAQAWCEFINTHPWTTRLVQTGELTFEIRVLPTEDAPIALGLIFSDWLAALRAALDNGLYDWAIADSGQNPPPRASSLQFPITEKPADFKSQCQRLKALGPDIIAALEMCQPYQSPYGPESNLLYWLNELARIDRHRSLHFGLGRIATQRTQVWLPRGTPTFDNLVDPFRHIDGDTLIARFSVSERVGLYEIEYNPGIGIDPEINEWANFLLNGQPKSLWERMTMMEAFMRNHVENMAHRAGLVPPGGFITFDPSEP
jgi:hypothetical protein